MFDSTASAGMSRRYFLRRLAIAAVALPAIGSSALLAASQDAKPKPKKKPKKPKKPKTKKQKPKPKKATIK